MAKKQPVLYPDTLKNLSLMGEQIKLARLRRGFKASLIAERAGITRATLVEVEKGSPSVSLGIYAAVLSALGGMDKDLSLICKDDETGRVFADYRLTTPKRVK